MPKPNPANPSNSPNPSNPSHSQSHSPNSSQLEALRQTTAELLACALCNLFPKTQLIKTTFTDIGFYCDAVMPQSLDAQALPLIEERMHALSRQNTPIKTLEMMRQNAVAFFRHHHQDVIADILGSSHAQLATIFQMGDFIDLCESPVLDKVNGIKAFKLQDIHTTRRNSKELGQQTVTRFIGTAFSDNQQLKKFLKKAEEAKKRNHLLIGPEMGLYSSYDDMGNWLWYPKGIVLKKLLLDLAQEIQIQQKSSFVPTEMPPIFPDPAIKKSLELTIDDINYVVGGDSATGHAELFRETISAIQQLPIRYQTNSWGCSDLPSEGLFQTRCYQFETVQIFCSPDKLADELISSLQFIEKIVKILGFDYQWYINTPYPRSFKNKEEWKKGVDNLEKAARSCGLHYHLDKQGQTLYGPRVEVRLADALGRYWPGPYVAINAVHPEALGLHYHSLDGKLQRPMMIARSIFGSLERFIAILIEHTAGMLPFWLSPEQVRVIPVTMEYAGYAAKVHNAVTNAGLRSDIDYRPENLGEKVHAAERSRVPYIVIVGDKEERQNVITVRSRETTRVRHGVTIQSFLDDLQERRQMGILVES